jgi:hypothetical protein
MDANTMKYVSIASAITFGVLILIGLMYKLSNLKGGGSSESYRRSLSMDKLYDEAGGNDPLSDARMTTQIDISSDDYSCAFLMTHKGVKDRQIECKSGCTNDPEDDKSNFCKQFIYKDSVYSKKEGEVGNETGSLSDNLLDKTYVGRRNAAK